MGWQTLEVQIEQDLAAKEAIEDGYDMPLESALTHEAQLFALCFATEDKAEGVNAFLEKRPPKFKGK